jgi:aryl-alcohol dehydrogenase-like predicted oxidoreductase
MSVGRLSLGTAQLGSRYSITGGGALSDGEVTSVLQSAVDFGITAIDTSPSFGLAEQRVGEFLHEHDLVSEISVCTKLAPLGSSDPARLEQLVEERLMKSLQRLRCDCVDAYMLQDIADLRRHGDRLVDALLRQRENGRVLDIGVSVLDPEDLEVVADYPALNVVQHPFSLLDRRLLEGDTLSRLRSMGTKLQIRGVLLQGLLLTDPDEVPAEMADARKAVAALNRLVADMGISVAEAAVAFAMALDADRIIIAADSSAQLEQLLAAVDVALPDGFIETLETEFAGLPATVYDPREWPASS